MAIKSCFQAVSFKISFCETSKLILENIKTKKKKHYRHKMSFPLYGSGFAMIAQIFLIFLHNFLLTKTSSIRRMEEKITEDLIKDLKIRHCIVIQEEEVMSIRSFKLLSRLQIPAIYKSENELFDYIKNESYVDTKTMIVYKNEDQEMLRNFTKQLYYVSIIFFLSHFESTTNRRPVLNEVL